MWKVLNRARQLGVLPVVPADVVAEWWRGRRCAAPETAIATPDGVRPIASLEVGDLVNSIDHGVVRAVPPPLPQKRSPSFCGACDKGWGRLARVSDGGTLVRSRWPETTQAYGWAGFSKSSAR
jgi:hypothetical protein